MYKINENIDGHPICKMGEHLLMSDTPMSKEEVVKELNRLHDQVARLITISSSLEKLLTRHERLNSGLTALINPERKAEENKTNEPDFSSVPPEPTFTFNSKIKGK